MADTPNRLPLAEDVTSIGPASYSLLANGNATGFVVGPMKGGYYLWTVQGTFNGATVTLQEELQDGTFDNFNPPAVATEKTMMEVVIGHGTFARVLIEGGPPTGIYSNLAGFTA